MKAKDLISGIKKSIKIAEAERDAGLSFIKEQKRHLLVRKTGGLARTELITRHEREVARAEGTIAALEQILKALRSESVKSQYEEGYVTIPESETSAKWHRQGVMMALIDRTKGGTIGFIHQDHMEQLLKDLNG